ncbi:hydrogenase maturation protease [Candidatus Sumerlaeota bacterium]|nr:hydrogenase maturation protease [Candidatus Sumerlaeota bacterium]
MKTLIIGYGSPLRSDDGAGPWLVDALSRQIDDPSMQFMTCHQLSPDLAGAFSRVDKVVFVDARRADKTGDLQLQQLSPDDLCSDFFSHHMPPQNILALCRALYGACPEALVVTVSTSELEPGLDLSPALRRALPEMLRRIKALLMENDFSGDVCQMHCRA